MAGIDHSMWVHGTSMRVEDPEAFNLIKPRGYWMYLEGKPGKSTWVHFAIPTPTTIGKHILRVDSVMLVFETKEGEPRVITWMDEQGNPQKIEQGEVTVDHVHVYDGATIIATHADKNLYGNIGCMSFEVPDTPIVKYGLGISVGLSFSPATEPLWAKFVSAGCNFLIPEVTMMLKPGILEFLKKQPAPP